MQIMAVVFAVCVFATPALAYDDDGWSPTEEILRDIWEPRQRGSDNPALDRELERWDRHAEWGERQQRMEYDRNERNRQNAISACSSIWHNPEAQAACRRSQGGY